MKMHWCIAVFFLAIFKVNLHLHQTKPGLSAAQKAERCFHGFSGQSAQEQTFPKSHGQVWWMSSKFHSTDINNQNNHFECNIIF